MNLNQISEVVKIPLEVTVFWIPLRTFDQALPLQIEIYKNAMV